MDVNSEEANAMLALRDASQESLEAIRKGELGWIKRATQAEMEAEKALQLARSR